MKSAVIRDRFEHASVKNEKDHASRWNLIYRNDLDHEREFIPDDTHLPWPVLARAVDLKPLL